MRLGELAKVPQPENNCLRSTDSVPAKQRCHLLLGCLWNESTLSTRCDHLPRHGTGGHSEKGALTLGAAERAPGAQRRLVKSGEGLLLGGEGELCPPGSRDANQWDQAYWAVSTCGFWQRGELGTKGTDSEVSQGEDRLFTCIFMCIFPGCGTQTPETA